MLVIDLNFTYKNNIRYLLINKLGYIKNTYNNLIIKKLLLFFYFTKLEDLDKLEIFNTFYLFKYFFGWNAFFSKTKSRFSLNKWYFSLNVRIIINKEKEIYKLLLLVYNNIINKVDKSFKKNGIFSKKYNIFFFILKDLTIFNELKTNFGLIYLKKPLNILIYLKGCNLNIKDNSFLLKTLKIF